LTGSSEQGNKISISTKIRRMEKREEKKKETMNVILTL